MPAASPQATAASPATLSAAPMNRGRVGFDAVVLGDGSVLAVGDDYGCYPGPAEPGSERAEVYERANDRWVEVESLNKPRKLPATVGLVDGSAMVIGGINDEDVLFSSTKLFSPTTRTWTDGPLLEIARGQPLAATLDDGRVLVASEVATGDSPTLTTTEIFDPSVGAWSRGASLTGSSVHELVALTNGLILGIGWDNADSEPVVAAVLYDAAKNVWVGINSPGTGIGFDIVALGAGGALAIGGSDGGELYGGNGSVTSRVDRLDPLSLRWSPVAQLPTARDETMAARLPDGRVLVAGGMVGYEPTGGRALTTVEAFDPESGQWTALPDLLEPRYDGQAVVLADGSVLVFGGYSTFNTAGDTPWCPEPMTSVERLTPPLP